MSKLFRKFNKESFTPEAYADYKNRVANIADGFSGRLCETPVLLDKKLFDGMIAAGKEIVAQATAPKALTAADSHVPAYFRVSNPPEHPKLVAVDFAITKDETGSYKPMLIELQAFSSIYAFMLNIAQQAKEAYKLDDRFQYQPEGKAFAEAASDIRRALVGDHDPKHVVLLEINPWKQATRMDFKAVADMTGLAIVDIVDVRKNGDKLYYNNGIEDIEIKRIYNRIIPEEFGRLGLEDKIAFRFNDKLDVEWVEHPSWFFLISKCSMPFMDHPNVPETRFLKDIQELPKDLENYVLKPLFAYSGKGVKIDVTKEDIDAVPEDRRGEFVLQKKVVYDQFIENPKGLTSKAEVRVMYLWDDDGLHPSILMGRVSRGKLSNMTGAVYGPDDNWIGLAPVMSVDNAKKPVRRKQGPT